MRKLITLIFVISSFVGLSQDGHYGPFPYTGPAAFAEGTNSLLISTLGSSYTAIWMSPPTSTTGNNFFIASNGTNDSYLNAPTDSADLTITKGNGAFFWQGHGHRYNSVLSSHEWRTSNRPNITVGQTATSYYFNPTGSKIWKTGAIAVDYNVYVGASSDAALGASTMTNKYNLWSDIPIQSTNLTITNKWGFGTNGSALITQSLVLGKSAATPAHVLDVTGGAKMSTTLSVGNTNTVVTGNSGTIAVITDDIFTISMAHGVFSPADGTTYYFGDNSSSPPFSGVYFRTYVPSNCTLIGYSYNGLPTGVAGTSELATLYVRVDNTTDITLTTIDYTSNSGAPTYNSMALNTNINSGSYITAKLVTPTWATNPTNIYEGLTLFFKHR